MRRRAWPRSRLATLALATALAATAGCGPAARASVDRQAALAAVVRTEVEQARPRILLVRHGETTPDGTRDPALSDAGRQRAERLARVLADAGVTRVLSTEYRRTRATAEPIARATGVDIEPYDPTDLAGLAARLGQADGVIVVVGHSNTTPELVRALGGEPGSPIAETEHDRLYVVVPAAAATSSVLLRY